jgi:hypothetical protein
MWTTKSTEKNDEFTTGSKRGSQEGKTRYDLIDPYFLKELGDLMHRGEKIYGENNWKLGQPISRTYASLLRHTVELVLYPKDEENHLAAIAYNTMVIIHHIRAIAEGELPSELADTDWSKLLIENYNARKSNATAPNLNDSGDVATIIAVNKKDRL